MLPLGHDAEMSAGLTRGGRNQAPAHAQACVPENCAGETTGAVASAEKGKMIRAGVLGGPCMGWLGRIAAISAEKAIFTG